MRKKKEIAAETPPAATPAKAKDHGLLRKAAGIGATVIATRVAAETGKKGVIGLIAGMGAKRLIRRHPVGAVVVAGAYLAGRLYEAKRELDERKAKALPAPPKPILIAEARERKQGGQG